MKAPGRRREGFDRLAPRRFRSTVEDFLPGLAARREPSGVTTQAAPRASALTELASVGPRIMTRRRQRPRAGNSGTLYHRRRRSLAEIGVGVAADG